MQTVAMSFLEEGNENAPMTGKVTGREEDQLEVTVMIPAQETVSSVVFTGRTFSEEQKGGLFDVFVSRTFDGRRETIRENLHALEWDNARRWVKGLMTMIGTGRGGNVIDVNIEPIEPPRPWTPELWSMYQREQVRLRMEERHKTDGKLQAVLAHNAYLTAEVGRLGGAYLLG